MSEWVYEKRKETHMKFMKEDEIEGGGGTETGGERESEKW